MAEILKLAELLQAHGESQVNVRSGWIDSKLHVQRTPERELCSEFGLRKNLCRAAFKDGELFVRRKHERWRFGDCCLLGCLSGERRARRECRSKFAQRIGLTCAATDQRSGAASVDVVYRNQSRVRGGCALLDDEPKRHGKDQRADFRNRVVSQQEFHFGVETRVRLGGF